MYSEKYSFREPFNIPPTFQRRVCTCEDTKYVCDSSRPVSMWGLCANCDKPEICHLFRCRICNEIFIHDFSVPWWCSTDATCWEHSQNIDKYTCPHSVIPMYRETGGYYKEPRGLNPIKYTKEELADVFDFD